MCNIQCTGNFVVRPSAIMRVKNRRVKCEKAIAKISEDIDRLQRRLDRIGEREKRTSIMLQKKVDTLEHGVMVDKGTLQNRGGEPKIVVSLRFGWNQVSELFPSSGGTQLQNG